MYILVRTMFNGGYKPYQKVPKHTNKPSNKPKTTFPPPAPRQAEQGPLYPHYEMPMVTQPAQPLYVQSYQPGYTAITPAGAYFMTTPEQPGPSNQIQGEQVLLEYPVQTAPVAVPYHAPAATPPTIAAPVTVPYNAPVPTPPAVAYTNPAPTPQSHPLPNEMGAQSNHKPAQNYGKPAATANQHNYYSGNPENLEKNLVKQLKKVVSYNSRCDTTSKIHLSKIVATCVPTEVLQELANGNGPVRVPVSPENMRLQQWQSNLEDTTLQVNSLLARAQAEFVKVNDKLTELTEPVKNTAYNVGIQQEKITTIVRLWENFDTKLKSVLGRQTTIADDAAKHRQNSHTSLKNRLNSVLDHVDYKSKQWEALKSIQATMKIACIERIDDDNQDTASRPANGQPTDEQPRTEDVVYIETVGQGNPPAGSSPAQSQQSNDDDVFSGGNLPSNMVDEGALDVEDEILHEEGPEGAEPPAHQDSSVAFPID